mgnify:CR=1 FL=1|jgi:hypothetical protein
MNLEDYIKIYDGVVPLSTLVSIIKWSKTQKFENGGLGDKNTINKNIRNVELLSFLNWKNNSKTKIHWTNFLVKVIRFYTERYFKDVNLSAFRNMESVNDISLLKYGIGGKYEPHTDHMASNIRVLSFILLLNNDYEGGKLKFMSDENTLLKKIDVQPSRLIVWPSNFMFPHGVEPITKGTRYSIVAWVQ